MIRLSILILSIAGASSTFAFLETCLKAGNPNKWIRPIDKDCTALDTVNLIAAFKSSTLTLGEGSFGEVRLVSFAKICNSEGKRKPEHEVAIKRVKRSKIELNELEVLEKLTQENQSPYFYGCARDDHYVYIVQEALKWNLDNFTAKTEIKSKTAAAAIKYFKTGFDALIKLEGIGWIHQDIKPANLMTDDTFSKVFLIDFGLAQTLKAKNHGGGTPIYTPISRIFNSNNDIMSDYYSYAVSIGSIYGNRWYDMFQKDQNGPMTLMNECFQVKRNDYNSKVLEDTCTKAIADNAVKVLNDRFGPNDDSKDVKLTEMNFTTLIVRLIRYPKYKMNSNDVKTVMESLTTKKIVAKKFIVNHEDFKTSQELKDDLDNYLNKIKPYEPIDHEAADNQQGRQQQKKERADNLQILNAFRVKDRQHMEADDDYRNNRIIRDRQVAEKARQEMKARMKEEIQKERGLEKEKEPQKAKDLERKNAFQQPRQDYPIGKIGGREAERPTSYDMNNVRNNLGPIKPLIDVNNEPNRGEKGHNYKQDFRDKEVLRYDQVDRKPAGYTPKRGIELIKHKSPAKYHYQMEKNNDYLPGYKPNPDPLVGFAQRQNYNMAERPAQINHAGYGQHRVANEYGLNRYGDRKEFQNGAQGFNPWQGNIGEALEHIGAGLYRNANLGGQQGYRYQLI